MHPIQSSNWFLALLLVFFPVMAGAAGADEKEWNQTLRPAYFGNEKIVESSEVVELTAPYRAEDPATVPIRVTAGIPQTPERYIEKLILLIDKNPEPFVGEFNFSEISGRADLAMRVRINAYSHVRAIARLNTGELHMHKVFVKASGGCSAPISADLEAAMKRLGRMKFRVNEDPAADTPLQTQLMISHPNITGMQMDQVTRLIKPAHYMNRMQVSFNGNLILSAKTDIAISADPNFRFFFVPDGSGVLKAEIEDSSGAQYAATYEVAP